MLHKLMKELLLCHTRGMHTGSQKRGKKGFWVHNSWNIYRTAWEFNNITHSLFPLCTLSRSWQHRSLLIPTCCFLTASCRALSPVMLCHCDGTSPVTVSRVKKKEITERTNSHPLYWEKWGKYQVMLFFTVVYEHGHSCPHFLLFTLVLAFRHLIFPKWLLDLLL